MKVLGEIFRKGSDSKLALSQLLNVEQSDVGSLAAQDPVNMWELAKAASVDQDLIAKLYYYHQPIDSPLWDALRLNGDRIIHVLRRNLFDAYVSRELAVKYKLWNLKSHNFNSIEMGELIVSEDAAQSFIMTKTTEIAHIRNLFRDRDYYYEVFYEDFSYSPFICLKVMQHIFGKSAETSVMQGFAELQYGRIKVSSNADIVQNYREVSHLDRPHVE